MMQMLKKSLLAIRMLISKALTCPLVFVISGQQTISEDIKKSRFHDNRLCTQVAKQLFQWAQNGPISGDDVGQLSDVDFLKMLCIKVWLQEQRWIMSPSHAQMWF